MRDLKNFEHLIYIDFSSATQKTKSFARCLIDNVDLGILAVGFELPSVDQLSELTKLSVSTIHRSFHIMVNEGYLFTQNGICAVIRHPSFVPPLPVTGNSANFYLDNVCMKC